MSYQLKKRICIFILVIVAAFLFLVPTFYKVAGNKDNLDWFSKPISLGLDLQGGAHLVYEVQVQEAVTSRLQSIANATRTMLIKEKIPVIRTNVSGNTVSFTLLNKITEDQAKEKIRDEYKGVIEFLKEEAGDGNQVTIVYEINNPLEIEREAVNKSIETLRNRVDQFGVSEPIIQRKGDKQILLQMPGATNIEDIKEVIGSVAKLEFRLVAEGEGLARSVVLKGKDGTSYRLEDVLMQGDAIKTAQVMFSHDTGQPEVSLTLNPDGSRTFANITAANIGRRLAIILDNVVYSAPNINTAIPNGSASITGGFTLKEASNLALVLRAGALPASLKILEERTVGPTLGMDSIRSGVRAILVGFGLVVVFMIFYYKKSGFVAVCSLAINLLLVLALLSAFGATLTLPGLAGLALTVGMAVDSNVIIFERIREELEKGVARDVAVHLGFEKAFSAIIDSNLTTLLTGIILFYFGTGPVRGFAVTLSIGVLTTLYCATFATHLIFEVFKLKNKKTNNLSI